MQFSNLTSRDVAGLVIVGGLIGGALLLLSVVGWMATIVLAVIALAIAYHVIPRGLVAVLAQVFALELILPKLGLIEFHGGFWSAVVAVIALIIGIFFTNILFNFTGVMDAMNKAVTNAKKSSMVRSMVAHWLAWTAVLSLALWIAAGIDDDIVTLGFVPTVIGGMVLSGIREFFHFTARRAAKVENKNSESESE